MYLNDWGFPFVFLDYVLLLLSFPIIIRRINPSSESLLHFLLPGRVLLNKYLRYYNWIQSGFELNSVSLFVCLLYVKIEIDDGLKSIKGFLAYPLKVIFL